MEQNSFDETANTQVPDLPWLLKRQQMAKHITPYFYPTGDMSDPEIELLHGLILNGTIQKPGAPLI